MSREPALWAYRVALLVLLAWIGLTLHDLRRYAQGNAYLVEEIEKSLRAPAE